MYKCLKLVISSLFFLLPVMSFAQSQPFCTTATQGGASLLEINMSALATIGNMLPIKIGSLSLSDAEGVKDMGDSLTSEEGSDGGFICSCKMPPPIFLRAGISISFWNPMGTVNTTSIPYCMPNLGITLPVSGIGAGMSFGTRSAILQNQKVSAQTSYFSGFNLLNAITDTLTAGCFQISLQTGVDHISELLPWWQNDTWASVFSPESLLIANPIAGMACVADALSVTASRTNINALFWCYGTWGSAYPMTVNVGSGMPLTSYAALATRTLAEQFKSLRMTKTAGIHMKSGYCQPLPTIFIVKNDLKMFPIYPFVHAIGFPIGYPSEIWGVGMDNPANMGVMTWMIYQKRDCCYL